GEILSRTILKHIADLVEDFTLRAIATGAGIDVVTAYVRKLILQPRNSVLSEVQLIACLPRVFILEVEVGVVGVGQVNSATAITVIVSVSSIAGAALVS